MPSAKSKKGQAVKRAREGKAPTGANRKQRALLRRVERGYRGNYQPDPQ